MDMFSSTVDMAVVTKWFLYWSRVAKKVTTKMRSKYQKFMAVSGDVSAMSSAFQPHASNLVMGSGKKVIRSENAVKKSKKRKQIAVAKTPLFLEAINEGITA